MNVQINRLDPNVPDPVESRRRAAGRVVRFAYSVIVFGILGFLVVYFGRPLVYLGGPGIVSSPRYVVSLPYIVQVSRMNVVPGATVLPGDGIARVHSPQVDSIVATYMQALADVATRTAELRVKARVAEELVETAREYQRLTGEAAEKIASMSAASVTFQVEIFRERAAAQKALITNEAEAAEAKIQLASLDEFSRQLRAHRDEVERSFADGQVIAPIGGIISTNLARTGQSLVAGTSIAEILDPTDVFVDWYIPNERLFDPEIGNSVIVLFGNRRFSGRITEILRVSDVYAGSQQVLTGERIATQIARIRLSPGVQLPTLNATVYVHMHYSELSQSIATLLIKLFLGDPGVAPETAGDAKSRAK